MRTVILMLSVALLATVAPVVRAQPGESQVEVRLTTERPTVFVGDATVVNVVVLNADNPTAPNLQTPPGVDVEAMARQEAVSQFITTVNGRRQTRREVRYTYPFVVTPTAPGRYVIGPAQVTVDGVGHMAPPITIVATEPTRRDDLQLRLELEKTTAYVGEPVTLLVTWMMRSNISNQFTFTLPGLPPSIEAYDVPSPTPNAHDIRAGRYAEFEFLGSTVIAERATLVEQGVEWTTYSFRKVLIATEPGAFDIGPAYFRGAVEVGRRRTPFGVEPTHQRVVVPSGRAMFEATPLPDSNRPGDFSGLVGAYRVTSRLNRTDMNVGDPVTLSVRISGPPPIARATTVDVFANPTLQRDFRISRDDIITRIDGGTLLIETTIRPLSDRVDALPGLSFSYFDPESGAFERAETNPIPITVHETRIVTAEDALGAELSSDQTLSSQDGGFAHLYLGDHVVRDQRYDVETFLRSPLGVTAIAAPPAMWLSIIALGAGRRLSATRRVRNPSRRAATTARTSIKAAESPNDVAQAIRAYLNVAIGTDPAASPQDVAAALSPHDQDISEAAASLLSRLDEAAFAGAAQVDIAALRQEAASIVESVRTTHAGVRS